MPIGALRGGSRAAHHPTERPRRGRPTEGATVSTEAIIGLLLILISIVEIVGIIRIVSVNAR